MSPANTTPRIDGVEKKSRVARSAEGVWYVQTQEPLGAYPRCLTDRLVEMAYRYPDRSLVAQRDCHGGWRRISYSDMLLTVRRLGQSLLDRGLTADRPLLILSGNEIEHLQLALAALYAGVPYCPVSPAYSLVSRRFTTLSRIVNVMTPGLVFASDGELYAQAIGATIPQGVEVVTVTGRVVDRDTTSFLQLSSTSPSTVDVENLRITPDQIAKFLFTSGSTSQPKAVITTHRMLCVNQQMLLQSFPSLGEKKPVLVDWLPWNHIFGGSHNVGLAIYNGGTYYIDEGKPTEEHFAITCDNLRDISPTVHFNVPMGWEYLINTLECDSDLRESFFRDIDFLFYAGAGLSQSLLNRLNRMSKAQRGECVPVMSGLGMTETAPTCTLTMQGTERSGFIGHPVPGCEAKLVPHGEKYEICFRGPHVTPGYWRMPAQTERAFDEEGYYRSGDAVRFKDWHLPETGLVFDGRINEDFKLSSGTSVSVGRFREHIMRLGAPCVQGVVITGINRDAVGALIFPRMDQCRALSGQPISVNSIEVLGHPNVIYFFRKLLIRINNNSSGSARRLSFVYLMSEPPDMDHDEITDKGGINQNAVIENRSSLIDELYSGNDYLPRMILAANEPSSYINSAEA
jgi:feruloyl-CoA synthase